MGLEESFDVMFVPHLRPHPVSLRTSPIERPQERDLKRERERFFLRYVVCLSRLVEALPIMLAAAAILAVLYLGLFYSSSTFKPYIWATFT